KAMAPNAENLNFAVDADVLLDTQGWLYEDKGPEKLASFQKNCATPPAAPNLIKDDAPKK
ncbi:MAG TPA: hypothetical protein VM009_00690, partial [Terriglobales bacterium]|nr:hypothetical protein [Terriglobales bacterium]